MSTLKIESIQEKIKFFIERGFKKSQIDICADCGCVGLRENAKSEKLEERIDFAIYQINCPNDDCGKRIRVVLRNNHYAM